MGKREVRALGESAPRRTVDATDEFFERVDAELDARLGERVVVLDAVEQLAVAPEAVGLEALQVCGGDP